MKKFHIETGMAISLVGYIAGAIYLNGIESWLYGVLAVLMTVIAFCLQTAKA